MMIEDEPRCGRIATYFEASAQAPVRVEALADRRQPFAVIVHGLCALVD